MLVEFIPADAPTQPAALDTAPTEVTLTRGAWEETLHIIATTPGATVKVPRSPNLKREQVVNAFLDAFELIGGTPRLVLWGAENPGEFYKLWAKLAPKQIEQETQVDGGIRITHVLPRGALDE